MRSFTFFFLVGLYTSVSAQTVMHEVVNNLNKGNFYKVYRCFDERMKETIKKDQLEEVWKQLTANSGKYIAIDDIKIEDIDDGIKESGTLRFEGVAVKMLLSQNSKKKISGLYVTQLGYQLASYAKELSTGKKYIDFKSDTLTLSGELVIPIDCNNCPVAVLVHGSGPNDKDETIGPNKVFYDLAMGLARNGVATFRYDKRFRIYPNLMTQQFDLYDETIDDAIAALTALQEDTSLSFGKYTMLGHSLGAYALPLIADSLDSKLDAAILFSANARRLEDLIEHQMNYLTNFDGEITDEEEEIIINNTARAQNIRDGNYTDSTSAEVLLAYWPGTFWKSIGSYDPVEMVKHNDSLPFLILQGEKDYQITMTDFAIWKDAVSTKPNVTMQSFPGLTHLFTPTDAERGSPQDYFAPNNVSEEVINVIAEWLNGL